MVMYNVEVKDSSATVEVFVPVGKGGGIYTRMHSPLLGTAYHPVIQVQCNDE